MLEKVSETAMSKYLTSYTCPDCGEEWVDVHYRACNSTCPECGYENTEPTGWEREDEET